MSMKTMKNNKGMAMVTVLIGVTFIIILASSLVYMSYMNFITKAVRNASTDNFYTDEYALDDLCMSMQQVAANCSSVGDAKNALLGSTVGVGMFTNANGKDQYNNDCVAAMIQVASQDATISVNTIVPTTDGYNTVSDNVIVNGSSIKLVGVEITSTTAEGYRSTISTDITISFPNGGLGDLDINDFSVIADSPINCTGGDVFFSGCVYMDKGAGTTALTVNSGANVHILSTRGIINGDIVVGGASVLSITGIVTVIGDIYVNDSAVLLCSDQLQHSGRIYQNGNARVVGIDPSTFGPQTVNTASIPTNGMSSLLLADYIWAKGDGHWAKVTLEDLINAGGHNTYSVYAQDGRPSVSVRLGMQGTENRTDDTLVLSSRDVTIRGPFSNSTIICAGAIEFGNTRSTPTYMQRMSDESFEAAKMGLIGSGTGSSGRDGFGFNPELGGGYGNFSFNGAKNSEIPTSVPADDKVTETTANGEIREYIFYGGKNYVPFGYFLVDNTSQIITDVFSGVQGSADPVNTNITIENWTKE